jgi:hypothetical protein
VLSEEIMRLGEFEKNQAGRINGVRLKLCFAAEAKAKKSVFLLIMGAKAHSQR